jgi:hypothetical protein
MVMVPVVAPMLRPGSATDATGLVVNPVQQFGNLDVMLVAAV